MIIKTTEELTDFTREKWKKSGLTIREIAGKIGKDERFVAKAVQKNCRSETSRNGIRAEVLYFLGFEVSQIFSVVRQKKSCN